MTAPVRLREPAAVTAELAALATVRTVPEGFRAGARAALLWVTRGGAGPLTGCMSSPSPAMRSIVAELSAAEAIIYGRPSALRDFALGVEHALMWAERATPTPPSARSMPACGDAAAVRAPLTGRAAPDTRSPAVGRAGGAPDVVVPGFLSGREPTRSTS